LKAIGEFTSQLEKKNLSSTIISREVTELAFGISALENPVKTSPGPEMDNAGLSVQIAAIYIHF